MDETKNVTSNRLFKNCEYCGGKFKNEDLRPYGKNKAMICYDCGMKPENKKETESQFGDRLNNEGTIVLNKPEMDGMNPAAVVAALKGDVANALIAATPRGIEAQEKIGQTDLCENSSKLPKEINSGSKEDLEAMGIVFGKDYDDLFVNVVLPKGWKIKASDHSMWSDLVDDKEKVKARIFYKAAFYDRSAHIDVEKNKQQ